MDDETIERRISSLRKIFNDRPKENKVKEEMQELGSICGFGPNFKPLDWEAMGCQSFSYDSEIRSEDIHAFKSIQFYARNNKEEIQEMIKRRGEDWKFVSFSFKIHNFILSYFHIRKGSQEKADSVALKNFSQLINLKIRQKLDDEKEQKEKQCNMQIFYKIHQVLLKFVFRCWVSLSCRKISIILEFMQETFKKTFKSIQCSTFEYFQQQFEQIGKQKWYCFLLSDKSRIKEIPLKQALIILTSVATITGGICYGFVKHGQKVDYVAGLGSTIFLDEIREILSEKIQVKDVLTILGIAGLGVGLSVAAYRLSNINNHIGEKSFKNQQQKQFSKS